MGLYESIRLEVGPEVVHLVQVRREPGMADPPRVGAGYGQAAGQEPGTTRRAAGRGPEVRSRGGSEGERQTRERGERDQGSQASRGSRRRRQPWPRLGRRVQLRKCDLSWMARWQRPAQRGWW